MPGEKVLCLAPQYVWAFSCTEQPCLLGGTKGECPARRTHEINALYEASLSLVCPVVARAVLRHAGAMHFTSRPASLDALHGYRQNVPGLLDEPPAASFLLDLQRAGLAILGQKKYSLDERLMQLGLFLEDAGEYIEDGRGGRLGAIVKSYQTPLFEQRFKGAIKTLSFDPLKTLDFLWGIAKNAAAQENSPITHEDLTLAKNVYHLGGTPDLARVARAVTVSRRSLRSYIYLRFPDLRERLLLHQFYTELYPCALAGGLVHNYWCFVLTEKIALVFLAALAATARQNVTESEIATLAARLLRLPQTKAGLAALEETLRGKEDDSLRLFALLFPVNESETKVS